MTMTVLKTEPASVLPPAAAAKVLPLPKPERAFFKTSVLPKLKGFATSVVPPAVVICLLLAVWEILCRKAGATLPPPSRVNADTRELIL